MAVTMLVSRAVSVLGAVIVGMRVSRAVCMSVGVIVPAQRASAIFTHFVSP